MLVVCRERRKGSDIIGFAGLAAAALSCSLLFWGTSGNPADTLDASKMTVRTSRLDQTGPRQRLRLFAVALLAAAANGLPGSATATPENPT